MVQSLAEGSSEAAQSPVTADHRERDRKAWNLPRASVGGVSHGAHRDGLDWDNFRDLYYPDSRRHDFKAIVAYGAYKSSHAAPQPVSEGVVRTGAASAIEAQSVGESEGERGASS